jgi:hypothetical protein
MGQIEDGEGHERRHDEQRDEVDLFSNGFRARTSSTWSPRGCLDAAQRRIEAIESLLSIACAASFLAEGPSSALAHFSAAKNRTERR